MVDVTEPLVSEVIEFPPALPRMELDVVTESEVRGKGLMGLRKTKLVGTVGPRVLLVGRAGEVGDGRDERGAAQYVPQQEGVAQGCDLEGETLE